MSICVSMYFWVLTIATGSLWFNFVSLALVVDLFRCLYVTTYMHPYTYVCTPSEEVGNSLTQSSALNTVLREMPYKRNIGVHIWEQCSTSVGAINHLDSYCKNIAATYCKKIWKFSKVKIKYNLEIELIVEMQFSSVRTILLVGNTFYIWLEEV